MGRHFTQVENPTCFCHNKFILNIELLPSNFGLELSGLNSYPINSLQI